MIDFSGMKKLFIGGVELKQLFINGTQVWKAGYKNWVPISTEADKVTIYNGGLGYIEGYRLSSSGSLKEQKLTATTGFIKAAKNDVVRMAGTEWFKHNGYNYFIMYDENLNIVEAINIDGTGNAATHGWSYSQKALVNRSKTRVYDENGTTRFVVEFNDTNLNYAYIRISAYGEGEDMVVTVNEEIE